MTNYPKNKSATQNLQVDRRNITPEAKNKKVDGTPRAIFRKKVEIFGEMKENLKKTKIDEKECRSPLNMKKIRAPTTPLTPPKVRNIFEKFEKIDMLHKHEKNIKVKKIEHLKINLNLQKREPLPSPPQKIRIKVK